jgi:hypothetical protein
VRSALVLAAAVCAICTATAAAGSGWLPIPSLYGTKIRSAVMEPAVKASNGKARISLCKFTGGHHFYLCLFGTAANPAKAAVEVERTAKCDYRIYLVDVTTKPASITHQTSFHHCF